jgi:hypothetical protein
LQCPSPQVGRFVVKGQPNPVDIVEMAMQHLAARRFLLQDTPPKSAKGRLLEHQTAKCAAVPAVFLPALALRYKQQHVQREQAAAAAAAAAELLRRSNNNNSDNKAVGSHGLVLAAGVGGRTSRSSGSFTSMLRQRSMPASVLASRDASAVSPAASAGSAGGMLFRVGPRQGSWVARAFSIGSGGSAGGSSSCSSPRGGAVQLQVLGQRESVQEDEEGEQQQEAEGSV